MRRQNVRPLQRLGRALGIAAAAGMVAACGGGGGTTSSVPPPAATTITGSVADSAGAPVADATVTLATTSGPPAVAQTTPAGQYTLTVDPAKVNTGTTLVVTVYKDGYQTCTGTVNTTTNTVAGCNTLTLAAATELYPAAADAVLVRLGDGETTGGAVNSKLQIATPLGLSKTIKLGWPAGLTLAAYANFTLNVDFRGLQANNCPDKVTVLQGATLAAANANPVRVFSAADNTLADSNSDGTFSSYALAVPTTLLNASAGDLFVKIESGDCGVFGAPGDREDDFEFVGLNGKFLP